MHGMQGTPYIYQGEELGMTNARYSIEEYRDIETLNMYRERREKGYKESDIMASVYAKSRDNARTPMQWDSTENAGFTEGVPWIKVNPNYVKLNAEQQMQDADSVFACYQTLIRLRKKYEVFTDGTFALLLEDDHDFFAYARENQNEKMIVVCNFYEKMADCQYKEDWEHMELLYDNYHMEKQDHRYRPYEARIYYRKKR